jgi:hypothetical protein
MTSNRAMVRKAMRGARCARCKRAPRDMADFTQWNGTYINSRLMNHLCPACQTPEEKAEVERNLARTGGNYLEMCEGYLFSADAFVRACQPAIAAGVPAPSDGYLAEHGDTNHVFIMAGGPAAEWGIGMAFPFDRPALDFVRSKDEEVPLISAGDLLDGDRVVVSIPLTEILAAAKVVVREAQLQTQVSRVVKAYLDDAVRGDA